MKRSLSKCQFVAFGSGALLSGVMLLVIAFGVRPLGEKLYQQLGGQFAFVVQTISFIPPVVFAFFVARYAKGHDKVAFLCSAHGINRIAVRQAALVHGRIQGLRPWLLHDGPLAWANTSPTFNHTPVGTFRTKKSL